MIWFLHSITVSSSFKRFVSCIISPSHLITRTTVNTMLNYYHMKKLLVLSQRLRSCEVLCSDWDQTNRLIWYFKPIFSPTLSPHSYHLRSLYSFIVITVWYFKFNLVNSKGHDRSVQESWSWDIMSCLTMWFQLTPHLLLLGLLPSPSATSCYLSVHPLSTVMCLASTWNLLLSIIFNVKLVVIGELRKNK